MDARGCLVGICILLAGCAAPAPPAVPGSETTREGVVEVPLVTLVHDGPASVNVTRWSNGSFQAYDACGVAGCATGNAYREVDLSDAFPADLPVRFRIDFNSPSSPLNRQPMTVDLVTDGASLYNITRRLDRGQAVLEGVLLRSTGTVKVAIVFSSIIYNSGAEVPYTLRLDIAGRNDWTPGGVPLLVHLSPGAQTTAQASFGGLAAVLYDPADSPVARLQSASGELTFSTPPGAGGGDYVIVFPEDIAAVQLRSNDTRATLRALPIGVELGPAHALEGMDPVTWSFDLDQAPLAVGAYERNAQDASAQSSPATVTLRSTAGLLLEAHLGCEGVCASAQYVRSVRSATGHPALVAGAYEVQYKPGASAGIEVGHFVERFVR